MTETAMHSWIESVTAAYPGTLFLVSAAGDILACRVGSEASDVDPTSLVGLRIEDVTRAAGLTNARRAIDRTLATGHVTTVEHDVLDDDGRIIAHRRHHYARANLDQVAVLSRDVTRERTRHDAERFVGEIAQLLLTATPASPEPVVQEVLARIAAFVAASNVDVFAPSPNRDEEFEHPFGWSDGREPTLELPVDQPRRPSWVFQAVQGTDAPIFVAADAVPEEAVVMRTMVESYGLAACGFVPIALGDVIPGFVSVTWRSSPTRVERERFESLLPLGGLLATILLRERAERYRIEADSRLRTLTEQSHEVLVLLDAAGQPTFLSQAVQPLSGRQTDDVGESASSLMRDIHPDDHEQVARAFTQAGRQPGEPIDFSFRSTPPEGGERRTVGTITNLLGVSGVDSYVVNARDVTAQYHARAALETAASTDRLTGLPNRETLDGFIRAALERGGEHVVVFLDLDFFKRVNDGYGHTVGDEVLIELGRRMRECVGRRGLVARFAGDEFVAIAPRTRGDDLALPDRLRAAVAEPVTVEGRSLRITASAGVAFSDDASTAESLVRDADTALYEAKRRGRDTFIVVDAELRRAAEDRVDLETALVRAVDGDELAVHFQPVVDLRTDRRIGVEALVRWHRPGHGLVEPDAFLPVAEEIGAISQIDAWMLREGLVAAAPWHHEHGITISVNLSTHDLLRDDLTSTVEQALHDAGVPPDALCLEVTETGYAHAPDHAIGLLQQLRSRGVHIAIDDFGSGYSSIERVRRFPVDSLKIDRSLVEPILDSDRDLAAVRAVIELAHSLELRLTAEGIATRSHHDVLRGLGCDAGQGYLYGAPVPAHEISWD